MSIFSNSKIKDTIQMPGYLTLRDFYELSDDLSSNH